MDTLSFSSNLRSYPIKKLERDLKTKPERFWERRGETRALFLFQQMARRVPAYKDWLKMHHIKPSKIKTIADFVHVPPVDKQGYLKKYPLEKLCWDGKFDSKAWTFASTSGTTGEPFYFPRSEAQDHQYALTAELYLRNNFQIHKRSTLYIDGFAMGPWIGGVFTYEAIRMVAEKGYSLSIATPGNNGAEVINTVKKLGKKFDQVILGGYPPFVKDTIDQGIKVGMNWGEYNMGIVFSAEGFSEQFRSYIAKHAKLKNIYTSSLNHYGTVDQGTHSHETPMTTLIRQLALNNKKVHAQLFPETNRLPTLTQYMPEQFYFEAEQGNLYSSAFSGLPMVRYDLKDRGGVISLMGMKQKLQAAGVNLSKEIKNAGIGSNLWNLPFVYLFERSDMVVSWHGANIYPEHIREAHMHKKVNHHTTGKFTMQVIMDKKHNPVLEINSELKHGTRSPAKLAEQLRKTIINVLLKKNSEYKILHRSYKHRMIPQIKLWPYQSFKHFKSGGKQKWVIK